MTVMNISWMLVVLIAGLFVLILCVQELNDPIERRDDEDPIDPYEVW